MSRLEAIVVLPTYNEAENIRSIINAILNSCKKSSTVNLRILVVDDNSPDGTADIVRELQKNLDGLYLLNGQKNGLGRAYIRGFQYSLFHLKSDVIVQMDADFSHKPSDLPNLFKAIEKGADYVIGSRYTVGGSVPGNWPVIRIINSKAANFIAHKLGGIDSRIKDTTGGFKAIRTSQLQKLDLGRIKTSGYAFQVSLLNEMLKINAVVKEVPIDFKERRAGSSKLKMADVIEFLRVAYGLSKDTPVQRVLRFAAVGASGLFVNLGVLYLLNNTGWLPIIISSAVATEISIINNFFLNNVLTFKSQRLNSFREVLRGLAIFHGAMALGFSMNLAVFGSLNLIFGVNYLIAQSIGVGFGFAANYWGSRKFVWNGRHSGVTV